MLAFSIKLVKNLNRTNTGKKYKFSICVLGEIVTSLNLSRV